ncbi:response regulator [Erythrobacter sp. LQ02-29]|uniref:response regulator n=1 Tax=Erythrobacter sp. LQ02-29 TaxID=2920384 RepID=UPI001F4D3F27|nr:response regulator [Erythrobacter sp. LQ02-29]MCP9222644.1 response regulator [Erythrobacter sp. LQ02-29]
MDRAYVLVAEDEHIIGCDLVETVKEAGFEVDGPMHDVSSAMLSYQKRKPDVAILDVQLGDGLVFNFAEQLIAENVPVIFHSGAFTHDEIAERFPGEYTIEKPCPPDQMLERVQQALIPK